MENKHTNIPTKVEEKFSFINLIRKLLNKTSKSKDIKGRIKYISYPPKKGFSNKQKREIEELEINDVSIVGENRDISLNDLSCLKKLSLGKGVIAVTEGSIPNFIEILELSETVKQIPPNAIVDSLIKRVQGRDFCIATNSDKTISDIYMDTDERLHFIETKLLSISALDSAENEVEQSQENIAENGVKEILEASSKFENKQTLYVYDEGKLGTRRYRIHAVLDEFPIPENRSKSFSDDKLIGILINGAEEVDLEELSRYQNLQEIYINKSIRVTGGLEDIYTSNKNEKYLKIVREREFII